MGKDLVTIVEQDDSHSQSWFLEDLGAGEIFRKTEWNGSSNDLIIKVCSIVDGSPDYTEVITYVEGVNYQSCDSTSGTDVPTSSPIVPITPTPEPSSSPTKAPTADCEDDKKFTFEIESGSVKKCKWLKNESRKSEYCDRRGYEEDATKKIKYGCRKSC